MLITLIKEEQVELILKLSKDMTDLIRVRRGAYLKAEKAARKRQELLQDEDDQADDDQIEAEDRGEGIDSDMEPEPVSNAVCFSV